MEPKNSPPINLESVAYWFFRLNGCLTIVNFIVHPDLIRQDEPHSQRTDVDILAVRFSHRCELFTSGKPMQDHEVFKSKSLIDIIIAEVKRGRCNLNGPWIRPSDQNMYRVLYAIGAFDKDRVPKIAEDLYKESYYRGDIFQVRLFAIGSQKNTQLPQKIVQLTWDEILSFIYERLTNYRKHKAQHEQWDNVGKRLYRLSAKSSSTDEFVNVVKNSMLGFNETF